MATATVIPVSINGFGSSTMGWQTCGYCGLIHREVCSRVKAIEYHPDGTVKRVEFR